MSARDRRPGDEEFFVGYLPVPAGVSRFLRRAVVGLALTVAGVAGVVALGQRPLGSGEFEYGVVKEIGGVLRAEPLPALWRRATAADGSPSLEVVPLVGRGKRGPSAAVMALAGREVRLTGTWIHRAGQRLFEVKGAEADPSENPPVGGPTPPTPLGRATLAGEIVDSKCYLGVMRPGDGKSHKDCAIRCISGGSPAALVARDGEGHVLVALLVSLAGRPLGPELLDVVAEPVAVDGELLRLGELTLFATSRDAVRRLAEGG